MGTPGGARTDPGSVDDLHASAVKACGLDDFGVDDDNYREALGVLLDSFVATLTSPSPAVASSGRMRSARARTSNGTAR